MLCIRLESSTALPAKLALGLRSRNETEARRLSTHVRSFTRIGPCSSGAPAQIKISLCRHKPTERAHRHLIYNGYLSHSSKQRRLSQNKVANGQKASRNARGPRPTRVEIGAGDCPWDSTDHECAVGGFSRQSAMRLRRIGSSLRKSAARPMGAVGRPRPVRTPITNFCRAGDRISAALDCSQPAQFANRRTRCAPC